MWRWRLGLETNQKHDKFVGFTVFRVISNKQTRMSCFSRFLFLDPHISPTAKLAMGSLAQNSFGAIRCSCNPRFRRRFRRVPVQKADEVPEGSGAES